MVVFEFEELVSTEVPFIMYKQTRCCYHRMAMINALHHIKERKISFIATGEVPFYLLGAFESQRAGEYPYTAHAVCFHVSKLDR